jgi:hypothetical protein
VIDWHQNAKALGFIGERDMWASLYGTQGKPVEKLAQLFGVGRATICRRLEMHQITRRSRGGPNNVKGAPIGTSNNHPDSGDGEVGDEE